jgi:bifunctional non-homologous end joining protein LigD
MVLVLLAGVVDMIANAFYLIAAREGPLSTIVTLSSLYPASTVLLARVILGERLNSLGLECFPRTTGGKGLHLVVPIKPEREWDEIKAFCQAIAQRHADDDPRRVTANMAKSKRQGRIFLDYLRNGRGATAIASYSTRARPGAPVAVPVTWDELTPALRSDRYNVANLRRRMTALRADPWEKFDACRRRLTAKMMKSLGLQ